MALDLLHNDFESTTITMLERGNKTINKIQQILAFTKAKFISKQAISLIGDLIIMSKTQSKKKVNSNNNCFNYRKLGYFGKNCTTPSTKKRNKPNKSNSG